VENGVSTIPRSPKVNFVGSLSQTWEMGDKPQLCLGVRAEKITSRFLDRLPPPQYNPEQSFYGMKE
jgi:hypothetical protein